MNQLPDSKLNQSARSNSNELVGSNTSDNRSNQNPLANLYFSLSIIILCGPIQRMFSRLTHFIPFFAAVIAFYVILMFLLRFRFVQRSFQVVLFAVFNSSLFQRYFRMCMQTENLLSANTPETGKLWFWFSFFVTSIFLGQYLYEPFFLPVFIDAFTFTLIVVYFQMRCSAIFELAASDTPLSWSSTLALFSSQLGFDRPLQNKLRIDETYKYMQPRLQVRHMWSKIQESMRTKVPPLPSGSAETGFQGFYGSAISAFTSAFVFLGIHVSQSRIEEHRSQQAERHHKETLAEIQQNNKETLAQNESKIQLEANRIRFEKLGELSNELDVRIDSLVEKIRKLGNTRGADPLKMQYSQDLMIARAKKERTDFERESIYLSEKIQLQGSYSSISDIKPPTVYSVLEPKLKGSEPMQAECLTEASYLGLFF